MITKTEEKSILLADFPVKSRAERNDNALSCNHLCILLPERFLLELVAWSLSGFKCLIKITVIEQSLYIFL